MSGTPNQHNFMHIGLVNLGVAQDLLDRLKGAMERSWKSSSKRAQVREV